MKNLRFDYTALLDAQYESECSFGSPCFREDKEITEQLKLLRKYGIFRFGIDIQEIIIQEYIDESWDRWQVDKYLDIEE